MSDARTDDTGQEVLADIKAELETAKQWREAISQGMDGPPPPVKRVFGFLNPEAWRIFKMWVAAYILIGTQFGFIGFIGEEAIQLAGFSGFGFAEAGAWSMIHKYTIPTQKLMYEWYTAVLGIEVITVPIPNTTQKEGVFTDQWETRIINKGYCLWSICADIPLFLNPLMVPAYRMFAAGFRDQIKANEERVIRQR